LAAVSATGNPGPTAVPAAGLLAGLEAGLDVLLAAGTLAKWQPASVTAAAASMIALGTAFLIMRLSSRGAGQEGEAAGGDLASGPRAGRHSCGAALD
jgi:hypothetical protein